jgi:UDP-N-acetylglucosamine 2-epimerase
MPYVEFLSLLKSSALTFSDSGSIQSEAAFFDVPCLVMRENTERPFYIQEGTSTLTGRDRALISHALGEIRQGVYKRSTGAIKNAGTQVAQRTVQVISDFLQEGRHEA